MGATYQDDILSQPDALLTSLAQMMDACLHGVLPKKLVGQSFQRYILTGMGSSYWALYPLYLRLLEAERAAWLVETSELLYHSPSLLQGKRTLVIAASQSGASAEIVRLLKTCGGCGSLIGLTNEPGSPLGKQASAALFLGVGSEASVSCKTYTASLIAQALLGDLLLDQPLNLDGLEQGVQSLRSYLAYWQAHVQQLESFFTGVRQVYLVGRGASLAAAGTGGLVVKEASHVAAEGMSSAGFRHGPLEMIGAETFVLVYAGTPPTQDLNINLYNDICSCGGRAGLVQIGFDQDAFHLPPAPEIALPMLEILPVQMITLALGLLHSHPAGVFQYSSKVTTSE
jgi:glucosamine--fructose-6-phosphate aminotransferase (isomerizing)